MKKYQAAPVTITRFDSNGQVVSSETFVPERKRSKQQYGDVTYFFRVMARQETGEEQFVSYAQDEFDAMDIAEKHLEEHPEHVAAWHERI